MLIANKLIKFAFLEKHVSECDDLFDNIRVIHGKFIL